MHLDNETDLSRANQSTSYQGGVVTPSVSCYGELVLMCLNALVSVQMAEKPILRFSLSTLLEKRSSSDSE